jgi:hypothetical protein
MPINRKLFSVNDDYRFCIRLIDLLVYVGYFLSLIDRFKGTNLCRTSSFRNRKNAQNYWVFGLDPSSGILKTREHNVSETASVSVLR